MRRVHPAEFACHFDRGCDNRCRARQWLFCGAVLTAFVMAGCAKADKSDGSRESISASAPDEESGDSAAEWIEEDPAPTLDGASEGAFPRTASSGAARSSAARRNRITHVRVFYGTDRKPTGRSDPKEFYSTRRDKLRLGFCDVSIPPGHKRGELESPSIWRFEFRENPKKHVMLRSVEPVDGRRFVSELQRHVESSVDTVTIDGRPREVGGEAFVFVHGYNVTFEDAARRTAQIAHDLEFRGAPIMFSWPSQGEIGLDSYRADGRSARWCEEHVMDFVTGIARHSGARRLHLIAHSMGNRIVTNVLRRLSYDRSSGANVRVSTK